MQPAFLLQADEHVDEVLLDGDRRAAGPGLALPDAFPLVYGLVQARVDRRVDVLQGAAHARRPGEHGPPCREEVGDLEAAGQRDPGLDRRQELSCVPLLVPEGRAGDDADR